MKRRAGQSPWNRGGEYELPDYGQEKMTVTETMKKIGKNLRRETEDLTAAPLPERMLEILAKLDKQARASQPATPPRRH